MRALRTAKCFFTDGALRYVIGLGLFVSFSPQLILDPLKAHATSGPQTTTSAEDSMDVTTDRVDAIVIGKVLKERKRLTRAQGSEKEAEMRFDSSLEVLVRRWIKGKSAKPIVRVGL